MRDVEKEIIENYQVHAVMLRAMPILAGWS